MARQPWGRETVVKLVGGEIRFRFAGAVSLWRKALGDVATSAKDLTPVFEWFGQYMVGEGGFEGSIMRNFAAEGRPKPWTPLSPAYAKRKRQKYGNRPILVASGAMKRGFRFEATPRTLRIWNLRDYYVYHQRGTRKMPQRQMLVLLRQDKAKLTWRLNRHLMARTDEQKRAFTVK